MITEVIFCPTKVGICSVFKSHKPIFVPVLLESFRAVCSVCRFPRQHSGSSPSFPEAGLSRPTNGITMVCYCLQWPRRSLTRIGALSQFLQLLSIWRSSVNRKKMSSVSAGVVNLQVWQLIGLFSTGIGLRNTWQPAACEGCIRMIVEWSKSSQNVQQISLHLSQIDSWWGMNLGVRKVDLGVSLRSGVIQTQTSVKDSKDGFYKRVTSSERDML